MGRDPEQPASTGAEGGAAAGGGRLKLARLGHLIQGAVFEVYRSLGPGFLEIVYERALLVELRLRGLFAYPRATVRRFVGAAR